MLSTLLCTRGGVITIKVHGQIYVDGSQHEEEHSYYGEELISHPTIHIH